MHVGFLLLKVSAVEEVWILLKTKYNRDDWVCFITLILFGIWNSDACFSGRCLFFFSSFVSVWFDPVYPIHQSTSAFLYFFFFYSLWYPLMEWRILIDLCVNLYHIFLLDVEFLCFLRFKFLSLFAFFFFLTNFLYQNSLTIQFFSMFAMLSAVALRTFLQTVVWAVATRIIF